MDVQDIARWQFGIMTVYHYLFVPITIGLSAIIAGYETAWVRTGNEQWLRLTKFFGKLFLINFALGVVTGIMQEFQFGMNWSDYSRFVGDVFGAPLAIEGLLAFFLESTFLGLWIFGWERLSPRLHATCIWLVHLGTLFSAYFILAANSWMQHPVGYVYNAATGRAEMNDFWAVMTNKVQLVTFPHTVLAAYMTGAAFVVGVAMWQLIRHVQSADNTALYLHALRTGAAVVLVAGIGVSISGDFQGKVMTEVQPMKMAAAEALYETEQPAGFSLFTVGSLDGTQEKYSVKIPHLLSFLATGSTAGKVEGINPLRDRYEKKYGVDPGEKYYSPSGYTPIIPITYWSFRIMIGLGIAGALGAAAILLGTRRGRVPTGKPWLWLAIAMPFLPLLANSFGWIFTEMGRQPWAVFGLMTTAQSVSPGVSVTEAFLSLALLSVVYLVLGVIEVRLMLRYIKDGAQPLPDVSPEDDSDVDRPLAFAY